MLSLELLGLYKHAGRRAVLDLGMHGSWPGQPGRQTQGQEARTGVLIQRESGFESSGSNQNCRFSPNVYQQMNG